MIIDRFRYMVGKFKHRVVNVLGGKNPKTKRDYHEFWDRESNDEIKRKKDDLVRKRSKLLKWKIIQRKRKRRYH